MVRGTLLLVALTAAAAAIGTAFSPWLVLHQPAVLLALSSDARHVLLVTRELDLWVVLAIALPRRMLSLIATYGLGAIYGRAAFRRAEERWPRVARATHWIDGLLARVGGPLLLIWPGYTLSLLSGARRSAFGAFVLFTALGQLAQLVLTYLFGDFVSDWTAQVLAFLSEHVVESTAVCVALVAVQQVVSIVRRRRARLRERRA